MSVAAQDKTFCEFFAGIGLVHEGLRSSGWQCVYANDIEFKKQQMYEGHFGPSPYYHVEDIWQTQRVCERITARSLLATASFPCVDLSLAGYWKGFQGEHSSTYFGFLKVLEELGDRRPPLVMLENVYGFLTSQEGEDFRTAVRQLAAQGYWLDAIVLDARWFVPQSRPRVFVFGFGEEIAGALIRQNPAAAILDPWHMAIEQTRVLRPEPLMHHMHEVSLPTGWATLPFSAPRQARYSLADVIDLDANQDWWTPEQTARHYESMEGPSKERVDRLMRSRSAGVGAAFRRTRRGKTRLEVRFDVAGCLRTPKGGSARQIVVIAQAGEVKMRWMTAREYARLQGAGNYRIAVPEAQALYGFGDAVCVPAISWIDQHILSPALACLGAAPAAA